MPKLRVHNMSISVDGYGAGPNQGPDTPIGERGPALHEWVFDERQPALDTEFLNAGEDNIGATVMGRNMFGPVRGDWPDESWRGWWGDTPPYRHQVFVLTHHPRRAFTMDGGTTFNFVTDGMESALAQAFAAADGKDVRLGGGASTVQQYLRAGLVDYMHVAVVPVLLGAGESLFGDVDLPAAGYRVDEVTQSDSGIVHVRIVSTS